MTGISRKWFGVVTVILIGVGAGASQAAEAVPTAPLKSSSEINMASAKRGGGGEIPLPFPFTNANQHVELADGANYTLIGTIRMLWGEPYFDVDLKEHPWLENPRRGSDSMRRLYPVESEVAVDWMAFNGKYVKLYVTAEGVITISEDRRYQHEIVLNSKTNPIPMSRRGSRRDK